MPGSKWQIIMPKGILLLSLLTIPAGGSTAKPPILLGADHPYAYVSGIRGAFEQFHDRFHHYPKVWYDIWVNCSDNQNQAGCSSILRGPKRERKTFTPVGPDAKRSRYSYVIVSSGPMTYRIEVRDTKGKALFYSDEKHILVPMK